MDISRERRREIIAALRKGTVPQRGLDFLAVGLGRFEPVISGELADVAQGGSAFKAVRGDYGCGNTFFGSLASIPGRAEGERPRYCRRLGWLVGRATPCSCVSQASGRYQGRCRSLRGPEFSSGTAADSERFGIFGASACSRRNRNAATSPWRRAGEGSQRTAAAHR